MEWISFDEKLPEVGSKCWYYFDIVVKHRVWYEGLYVDDYGKEWPDMHIFVCDYGFLTGDVTHWHPDQETAPDGPNVIN